MNLKEVLDSLEKGHVVTASVNGETFPLTRYTEFSIEKKYISVGGVVFPKGLTKPPLEKEIYYVPSLDEGDLCTSFSWDGSKYDMRVLKEGLVHLNKDDAVAHAKALIKLSGGTFEC